MKRSKGRRPRLTAEDSLTTYLREIARYPLLTREQEAKLAARIRKGDSAALQRLVCSNLRFVVSVAKKYHNERMWLSDLIDEGNLGLMRAAERFDERRQTRFISYAVWWIRQAILQALADQSHIIRIPLSRAAALHRVGRQANALGQSLGRTPTQDELSASMGGTERVVSDTLQLTRAYVSLDAPLGNAEDARLLDYLPDDMSPAPDEEMAETGRQEFVREALTRLKGREATVLRLYFGFDGNEPLTLEEIGARLGVTRERVRQIKERALFRLRRSESRMLASV
ncbi:MAG TPA: RNA polymerase sigma factor RpoD/SigA [Gemmatimonadaceae bacterium]|nr:RNA polymerase sigma factor RpoD/SigA [Gemmatimonadaceae bacterium]